MVGQLKELEAVILDEISLSEREKRWVLKFKEKAENFCACSEDAYQYLQFEETISTLDIDPILRVKDGALMYFLWIVMLSVLKTYYKDSELKYPRLQDFLEKYPTEFNDVSNQELHYLHQTANWMNVLFSFMPARKNKGLAIHVVPKVIEGYKVKYVTGSGQKKTTSHRVMIFEREGSITPFYRSEGRKRVEKAGSETSANSSKAKVKKRVRGDSKEPIIQRSGKKKIVNSISSILIEPKIANTVPGVTASTSAVALNAATAAAVSTIGDIVEAGLSITCATSYALTTSIKAGYNLMVNAGMNDTKVVGDAKESDTKIENPNLLDGEDFLGLGFQFEDELKMTWIRSEENDMIELI